MQEQFLQPTEFIDSDHQAIRDFARNASGDAAGDREAAVNLYYAVRDGIRYTPYLDFTDPENYRASSVLARGYGFCISKASLLAACCRSAGIPARLGFADVRNHLTTPRLRELNGGDLMRWHAYTEILLDGRWVKATPAFNLALCTRFRVRPLEFDGREDSIFHPFDADQRRHMEYVRERGVYDDVPLEEILATFHRHSPKLLSHEGSGDFEAEAEKNSDGCR
ncbi:transglutaminase superfamily protein [Geothermobacter ehrlichii]|uniref:Transglutaminase superfamily protein n=1 Tax=Geothermobacter ehrlichii TaxID=213224 RepID=A0A5D3WF11_9BACT|nr:transglutaminase family protein [Geothermobacter ehrlichii]TYO94906.1 transglutaminase superfamily protein [Geothermobacter ehrlichii]